MHQAVQHNQDGDTEINPRFHEFRSARNVLCQSSSSSSSSSSPDAAGSLVYNAPPPGRRASATWQHNVISDNSATWCNENDNGHKRRYLDNAGWWWDRKIPRLNPSCSLTHVYLSVAEKLGQEHNNLAPRQEFTRSVIVGLMVSNGNLPQVLWDRHLQRAMTCINLALCIGDFLSAKTASASVRLSHRNSVRLSVRLSHRWISQKRCKLGSSNFHRRLPGKL